MMRYIVSLSETAAAEPEHTGPKAANLAALTQAGLPTPGGICLTAEAYRRQIAYLGLAEVLRQYTAADPFTQRRLSVEIRLKLYQDDVAPDVLADMAAMWGDLPKPAAVRSSALIEDRADASFAGQFESFLGISERSEFLTAVRACWAALWTTNARRGMERH